jgi:hypothetical protein
MDRLLFGVLVGLTLYAWARSTAVTVQREILVPQ